MHIRSESEAAEQLGVSVRTLQRLRASGEGPSFVRLGKRRLGYTDDGLAAWTEQRTFASRAAELSQHVIT